MSVIDAIYNRRSIRRFEQTKIPESILEKLVDCGRLAPSAANLQPIEYIVIDREDVCQMVFPALRWAAYIHPQGIPKEGERPVAYIIVLINTEKTTLGVQHDTGAAIENILLAAYEEGIGSCWIGSIEREVLKTILKVPDHCQIDSVIALGYPLESPVVEEMRDSIRYWKDDTGILHVPKRPLKDILHKNIYRT
ncbi:TPA: nitroreductase [bacterium]|nr:nitroreductase [bacterium]